MSLFKWESFISHSGLPLDWKIECDNLTDEDIHTFATLIQDHCTFSDVYGVPRGGIRLAEALMPYCTIKGDPTLIVDDVLTTGLSMQEARNKIKGETIGVVIFARNYCPAWIIPIFKLELGL